MSDETGPTVAPPLTPVAPAEEPKTDRATAPDVGVDVAFRWAQLYKNDFEYEQFFDWIDRRSNPERTDFRQILDSIPLTWGPEELPPPLRRFFMERFSQ